MNRRNFMKLMTASSAISIWPGLAQANNNLRSVVLIKLTGGNDGLNTIIPYQDPLYYELRPKVAIPRHQVVNLEKNMGLNPYMKPLLPSWNQGEIAWIQGLGYPNSDLSHFRSIDVWETAGGINQNNTNGWLNYILPRYKKGLHGIVMGDDAGPLEGKDCNAIAMKSPEVFLSQVNLIDDIQPGGSSAALRHVTNVQHQLYNAGEQLRQKMARPKALGTPFATSVFGRKLESVAKMIVNDMDAAVYKVELDGFDTHVNQHRNQNVLLQQLSTALQSFATTMKRHNKWNNVLVVTYSEFGRRVQENHGGGTDHGTANTHLVMGGRVRGGIYGSPPRLNDLDHNGNMGVETDFRKLYATIAQQWWRQSHPWKSHGILPIIS